MKKLITLAALVVACLHVNAQKAFKDSILTLVSKDACSEIEKIDPKDLKKDELSMQIGLAMISPIAKFQSDLEKIYGTNDMEELMDVAAEDIAMQLVVVCPTFLKLFTDNPSLIEGKDSKTEVFTVKGTLQKINKAEFTSFEIKDEKGKTHKIWWMEFFEGANEINANALKKSFEVSYTEKEIYNAATDSYIKIKIAQRVK